MKKLKAVFLSCIVLGTSAFLNPLAQAADHVYKRLIPGLIVDGAAAGVPVANVSTHSILFPDTVVGQTSETRTVRLSNTGSGTLTLSMPPYRTGSSSFTGLTTNCGASLEPGQFCDTSISFTPGALGAVAANINIKTNAGDHVVGLTGTGLGAVVSLVPASGSSVDYGTVEVGSSKDYQYVFTNNGTAAATNVFALLSGDELFIVGNTCGSIESPGTVAAGTSCTITIRYIPQGDTTAEGDITVSSSAPNGDQTLLLTGQGHGVYAASLSTSTFSFNSVFVNAQSSRTTRLFNTGSLPLTVGTPTLRVGSSSAFSTITTNCPASLDAGTYCDITVTFKPLSKGTLSGHLDFTTEAQSFTVTMTGTGV